MAQVSFGTILRKERERQGYDLLAVAKRLRIRPDILRSIESSDFDSMPPRGYARNMVNAYARFLGLNPTEVTRLYLDEAYARQVQHARSAPQSMSAPIKSIDTTPLSAPSRPGGIPRQDTSSERQFVENDRGSSRTLYVDDRSGRYRRPDQERVYSEERAHRSMRSAVPETQYTNFYAGPKAGGDLLARLPVIALGALVLALVVLLVFFLFFNKKDSDGDIVSVPVTGVSSGEDGQAVLVPPTKTIFKYEVADGEDAWIEVYVNDEALEASVVSGPANKRFDVTTTLRLVTARPDAVKVFVDDEEVGLTNDDGQWTITVSFPVELAKWMAAHPQVSSPGADGTGGNATGADGQGAGADNAQAATGSAGNTAGGNA
ncbi:MAG: helix-turn-helix domain-containing protein [Eggerthellaceae bacterium]|nr:helix-turn-helix domain-containing protein [Eggerthellaceae bacterium]